MLGTDGGVGDQNTHKGDCWEGNAENPSPSLSIQHGDPAALTRGLSALCAAGRIRPILHSPGAPTLPRPCVGPSAALRPPCRVLPVNSNEGGEHPSPDLCSKPTQNPHSSLWQALRGSVGRSQNIRKCMGKQKFRRISPLSFYFCEEGQPGAQPARLGSAPPAPLSKGHRQLLTLSRQLGLEITIGNETPPSVAADSPRALGTMRLPSEPRPTAALSFQTGPAKHLRASKSPQRKRRW